MRTALFVICAVGLAALATATAGAATAPVDAAPDEHQVNGPLPAGASVEMDIPAARQSVGSGTHAGRTATDGRATERTVTDRGIAGQTAGDRSDACAPVTAGDAPADPEEDRLGWEIGCWHNETIEVTRHDGLNETELDAVVARSMARVERIREVEFERTVPVEVLTREELREVVANESVDTEPEERLFHNAVWEAAFMVDESTDAVEVEQTSAGGAILGFYDPGSERIVVVSENATAPEMNEITLSQELYHALQDRKFDLTSYDQSTIEKRNAVNGIIEGDGNYVDYLYEQRCGTEWDCLSPQTEPGGGGLHLGMWMVSYVPYSEGPELVHERYQADGWAAIDAMYGTPPASTEQLIHHDEYPDETPAEVTVDHEPRGDWRVVERPSGPDHESLGEGGLFSMFGYATFQASDNCQNAFETVVVSCLDVIDDSEPKGIGQYSYSHPVTAGWAGDRLVAYADDSSAATGETGYVWKIRWDSVADAEEFVDGYAELLDYHGAEPVADRPDAYRISEDRAFGDAYHVNQTGETVLIVNAPTVRDLEALDPHAAANSSGGETANSLTETDVPDLPTETEAFDSPTETEAFDSPTETESDDSNGSDAAGTDDATTGTDTRVTESPTDESGPGFGPIAALLAALATALAIGRSA